MREFDQEFEEALKDPQEAEDLYRRNKNRFVESIKKTPQMDSESLLLQFWRIRLSYKSTFDLKIVALLIGIALLCWIPTRIFITDSSTSNDNLLRYFGSVFFISWGLAVLLTEKRMQEVLKLLILPAMVALFFYFIPVVEYSQSRRLAVIHSYLLLWCSVPIILAGLDFLKSDYGQTYIEKTGEALCWTILFLIGGIVLSGVTLGLFETLGIKIWDFYLKNVVTFGLIIAPILGLYFANYSNEIRISNILAKVFSPLAVVTVIAFIFAEAFTYQKLFNEKDAFIFYSLTPVFMVAIIFFVNSKCEATWLMVRLNAVLSIVSSLFIALILPPTVYRILTWGLSPNKVVILGIQLILLSNLIYLSYKQIRDLLGKEKLNQSQHTIKTFLPIYLLWAMVVVFVIPIIFSFK
jgi:hypothetical protein